MTRPKIGSIIRYHNYLKSEMFFVLDILNETERDTSIKVVLVSTGKVDDLVACARPTTCKQCWYSTWDFVE